MGFCTARGTATAARSCPPRLYAHGDGTTVPARTAAGAGDQRAVLDGLRQRRLLDLLRARTRRLVRARTHPRRVRGDRGDLLPDRRHVRGGDRDVSRGGRLLELRAPRVQRAVVLL